MQPLHDQFAQHIEQITKYTLFVQLTLIYLLLNPQLFDITPDIGVIFEVPLGVCDDLVFDELVQIIRQYELYVLFVSFFS